MKTFSLRSKEALFFSFAPRTLHSLGGQAYDGSNFNVRLLCIQSVSVPWIIVISRWGRKGSDTFCWGRVRSDQLTNYCYYIVTKKQGHRKYCGQPSCSLANFGPTFLQIWKYWGARRPPRPPVGTSLRKGSVLRSWNICVLKFRFLDICFCIFWLSQCSSAQ